MNNLKTTASPPKNDDLVIEEGDANLCMFDPGGYGLANLIKMFTIIIIIYFSNCLLLMMTIGNM